MPSIHELFKRFEGFTYCTTLDLNMGFWTILLDKFSQCLCTIILPWGKYCYLRLPMGLACSPDIYQEKMSELFIDMTFVIKLKTVAGRERDIASNITSCIYKLKKQLASFILYVYLLRFHVVKIVSAFVVYMTN
jgi:hypothetical protein